MSTDQADTPRCPACGSHEFTEIAAGVVRCQCGQAYNLRPYPTGGYEMDLSGDLEMNRDIDFSEFLKFCYGTELPEHIKAWIEHIGAGGTEKSREIVLHPRALRPRRRLPLVPGVRYVCLTDTLEHYRKRAEAEGLMLVEVPMSKPGASAFEVSLQKPEGGDHE